MERSEVIAVINKIIVSGSVDADKYIPLFTEFLEKKHPDKVDKIIQFVLSQPILLGHTLNTVIDYAIKEYSLFVLNKNINGQLKPILYYYEV